MDLRDINQTEIFIPSEQPQQLEALFNGALQGEIDRYMQPDYKETIGLAHNSTYVPDAAQYRTNAPGP
jgi:hypothetical protein